MRGRAKKLYAAIALALVAVMVTSTAAMAAVTFDPPTGTGFVGKGDVQLAFGWNNADLQSKAAGVTFTYQSVDKYVQSCQKIIENKKETKVLEQDFNKTQEVNSTVAYDTRKNSQQQITGFNLTGFGSGGDTSAPTDLCNPGNDENNSGWEPDAEGDYPEVTLIESGTSTLSANHGGTSVPLNWPAPAV